MSASRLYISGPMTGWADYNYPAFAEAASVLRAAGYDVASPHETDFTDTPEIERTWDFYMRRAIALMLTCDAVAVLPRWQHSRGAALEVHIAVKLDWPVREVRHWLAQCDAPETAVL